MATRHTAKEGPIAETAPERNEVLMSCGLISTDGAARRAAFMKITDWRIMTPKTPATQIHRTGLLAMTMMSFESVGTSDCSARGWCMETSG
jgi:hypothetical protein